MRVPVRQYACATQDCTAYGIMYVYPVYPGVFPECDHFQWPIVKCVHCGWRNEIVWEKYMDLDDWIPGVHPSNPIPEDVLTEMKANGVEFP